MQLASARKRGGGLCGERSERSLVGQQRGLLFGPSQSDGRARGLIWFAIEAVSRGELAKLVGFVSQRREKASAGFHARAARDTF